LKHRTIGIAFSAFILAAALGLAGTGVASAESVMKMCGDQWKQAKANGTTNGMTWKDFLAQCRDQQKGGAPAAAAPAAPAAAPPAAPAPAATAAAGGKSAKDCSAEYSANKDAIKASGEKKKDFIAACRSGTETVPPAPAAAAPPPPAPAAAPPAPAPMAPAPAPMAPAPKPMAAPTGAGEFQTDAEARGRCPTDTIVWVNTKTGIYHFAGTHSYGKTKQGAYMCEADAKAAGRRASEKEKHP